MGLEASRGAAKGCVTLQGAFPCSHVACKEGVLVFGSEGSLASGLSHGDLFDE